MNVTLLPQLPPQWAALEPVRLGDATRSGLPDRVVIVEDETVVLRCDVFPSGLECYPFEAAEIWRGLLLVGYGCNLYVVNLASRAVTAHRFGSYFGHLYVSSEYCLVASGCSLYRLGDDGEFLWSCRNLAVDGVLVHDVDDGVIRGDGEWDPPGGWRPFSVQLSTGQGGLS